MTLSRSIGSLRLEGRTGLLLGALACLGLMACPHGLIGSSPDYQEVLRSSASEPIDFVQIELDHPKEVRLEIYYSELTKKVAWSSQQAQSMTSPIQLGPGEALVQSEDWRNLGLRKYVPFPPDALQPPGSIESTEFAFLSGPLSAVAPSASGAKLVQLSHDGRVLLYTTRTREQDGPGLVELYQFESQQGAFAPSGSYGTSVHGATQAADAKGVIAQLDGDSLRVFTSTGEERARTKAGVGFQVAPNGRVLAVFEPKGVAFAELDANGNRVPGSGSQLNLPAPALDVAFAERWALVRMRKGVRLVDWRSGAERWRRDYQDQVVGSVDLDLHPDEELIAAIGRIEINQLPGRSHGQVSWGGAQGIVDVIDGDGDDLLRTFTFRTGRWSYDSPKVRILERSRRVIVRSDDVVFVSRGVMSKDPR